MTMSDAEIAYSDSEDDRDPIGRAARAESPADICVLSPNFPKGMATAPKPNLREIYRSLRDTLPWPKPIPAPEQVTFCWGPVQTSRHGSCDPKAKIITICRLYQDERLRGELVDVMAHEAAHFVWTRHSRDFREFLCSGGVAERFRRAEAPPSETLQSVEAEWFERYSLHASRPSYPRRPLPRQIEFPFED
jgi:hypothetical protein